MSKGRVSRIKYHAGGSVHPELTTEDLDMSGLQGSKVGGFAVVLCLTLILGLAVLALATVPPKKPGLAPKRLMNPTPRLKMDKALGTVFH